MATGFVLRCCVFRCAFGENSTIYRLSFGYLSVILRLGLLFDSIFAPSGGAENLQMFVMYGLL